MKQHPLLVKTILVKDQEPLILRVPRTHQCPRVGLCITLWLCHNLSGGSISTRLRAFSRGRVVYAPKVLRLRSGCARRLVLRVGRQDPRPITRLQVSTHKPALLAVYLQAL